MQIRTDLAMESREWAGAMSGVRTQEFSRNGVEETRVYVETEEAAQALQKERGQYITLTLPDFLHAGAQERTRLARALADALRGMLPPQGDLMIVGLGNRHMTADALGTRTLEGLLITRHMKDLTAGGLEGRLRGVCAIAPGVLGVTGMETAEVVQGMVEHVRPAAVIAIDALAARESSRICTTIQITDTGISPGSGVGNHRMGLNQETLHIPVIAVGVPMVVYAAVIARDALGLLMKEEGIEESTREQALDDMIAHVVHGGLGEMVVTPREVDELVGKVAAVLADGLNFALQSRLSEEEIRVLSHDGW